MTGASATVALIASIAITGAFSVSGSRALTLADGPRFEAPTTCSDVTKINVACVGDSITAGARESIGFVGCVVAWVAYLRTSRAALAPRYIIHLLDAVAVVWMRGYRYLAIIQACPLDHKTENVPSPLFTPLADQ
jgi:hypothetical protein